MTTFTVNNANDSGAGSLRQAILDAGSSAGKDIIDIKLPKTTINLNSPLPTLETGNDIDFQNSPLTTLTISGQSKYNIFTVNGANVSFSDLKLTQGLAKGSDGNDGGGGGLGAGGALTILRGSVTANYIDFTENKAEGVIVTDRLVAAVEGEEPQVNMLLRVVAVAMVVVSMVSVLAVLAVLAVPLLETLDQMETRERPEVSVRAAVLAVAAAAVKAFSVSHRLFTQVEMVNMVVVEDSAQAVAVVVAAAAAVPLFLVMLLQAEALEEVAVLVATVLALAIMVMVAAKPEMVAVAVEVAAVLD